MRKTILITGIAALAGALVPGPASASPAGKPVRCLQQAADQVAIAHWPAGTGRGHTGDLVVAAGSPCRDVNVRGVVDVDGKPTCRRLRVKWSNGRATSWRRTCTSWTVLAGDAKEGRGYVIEAQGRPASVSVRS